MSTKKYLIAVVGQIRYWPLTVGAFENEQLNWFSERSSLGTNFDCHAPFFLSQWYRNSINCLQPLLTQHVSLLTSVQLFRLVRILPLALPVSPLAAVVVIVVVVGSGLVAGPHPAPVRPGSGAKVRIAFTLNVEQDVARLVSLWFSL